MRVEMPSIVAIWLWERTRVLIFLSASSPNMDLIMLLFAMSAFIAQILPRGSNVST